MQSKVLVFSFAAPHFCWGLLSMIDFHLISPTAGDLFPDKNKKTTFFCVKLFAACKEQTCQDDVLLNNQRAQPLTV